MIDYQVVKQWSFDEVRHSYGETECMLYALAVGLGADPESPGELRYTYEKDLRLVPTMATVIGAPGAWWRDPRTGADGTKLVHGEQRLRLFKPLPPAGTLAARLRSLAVRFTAPVFPGDVLKFEFWRGEDRGSIRLRARCEARNATVLDQGVAEID